MSLFWELSQESRLAQAGAEAARGVGRAERARLEAHQLDERIDRLALVCMALWELLKERTDLTEEDLIEKVRQVDLMDGREDGKVRKDVQRCVKCSRVMSRRHKRCLYCGAANLAAGAFDAAL